MKFLFCFWAKQHPKSQIVPCKFLVILTHYILSGPPQVTLVCLYLFFEYVALLSPTY